MVINFTPNARPVGAFIAGVGPVALDEVTDRDGNPWPVAHTSNGRRVLPGMKVRDYNWNTTTVTDERPSIDGGMAAGRPEVPWFHTANGGFFDGSRLLAL